MKYGCVRLFKCGKNSKDDERESFKFNEYSIKASYKLLKISYNTDNLGFKNIKTNKPTSARGRHFQEEQFKQNYRDQICFCYELPLFLCLRRLNPAYLPSRC